MNKYERDYKLLLDEVIQTGIMQINRTDTPTLVLPMQQLRISNSEGFPLITGRRMFWRNVQSEVLWLLNGETNIARFKENGISMWDAWADENGNLGPVYGQQLRKWRYDESVTIDQLSNLVAELIRNPNSRRHVITMWNPADLDEMRLPPCYYSFDCVVVAGTMHIKVNMRSSDLFVGLPYDVALFAVVQRILCGWTGLIPGDLVFSMSNAHIYTSHLDQVREYMHAATYQLPIVTINAASKQLAQLDEEDIKLHDYSHGPRIKVDVVV